MSSQLEFCYWPVKFRAEYLRWIIAYLKIDIKETSPRDFDDWGAMKAKFSSKNPLINLPYLYDPLTDKVTSECPAIGFALALKYGGKSLLGTDGQQIAMHRSLQEGVKVIREFAFKCFNHDQDDLKSQFDKIVKSRVLPKLRYFDQYKRMDYKFMMGEVTLVDFEIAHVIQILDFIESQTGLKNPIADCQNIYQIARNVRELPGVG
jgi:glutathione S-transferase